MFDKPYLANCVIASSVEVNTAAEWLGDFAYDPAIHITAKELRDRGCPVPEAVADKAFIPLRSVSTVVTAAEYGSKISSTVISFSEPFRATEHHECANAQLHALRIWHAKGALYNKRKAAEYTEAASANPTRWSRLMGNVNSFKESEKFHEDAVATLDVFFPGNSVWKDPEVLKEWRKAPRIPPVTMKKWKFSFDGLALGGEAIVIAPDEETARQLLDETGTPRGDRAEVVSAVDIRFPSMVHYDNGDY